MRLVRAYRSVYEALSSPTTSPYICKACRREATRSSTLAAQQLRFASSLTERIRSKIWRGDNAELSKDTYAPSTFSKTSRTSKLDAGEQVEPDPVLTEEQLAEGYKVIDGYVYKAAMTWDGLEHIGHLGDWWDEPPTPKDWCDSYIKSTQKPACSRAELVSCLRQAIIEHYGAKSLSLNEGKLPQFMHSDFAFDQALSNIRIVKNERGEITSIEFASEGDRATIIDAIKKSEMKDQVEMQDNYAEALAIADESNQAIQATLSKLKAGELSSAAEIDKDLEREAAIASFDRVRRNVVKKAAARELVPQRILVDLSEDFLDGRLAWGKKAKFHILKRFSQLSGHRIPDPVLNSGKTLRDMIDHLGEAIQPKPKTLAETLLKKQQVAGIANLRIVTRRETPVDKEKELGRWKLIEAELKSRGLPVFGKVET